MGLSSDRHTTIRFFRVLPAGFTASGLRRSGDSGRVVLRLGGPGGEEFAASGVRRNGCSGSAVWGLGGS